MIVTGFQIQRIYRVLYFCIFLYTEDVSSMERPSTWRAGNWFWQRVQYVRLFLHVKGQRYGHIMYIFFVALLTDTLVSLFDNNRRQFTATTEKIPQSDQHDVNKINSGWKLRIHFDFFIIFLKARVSCGKRFPLF